MSQMKATLQRVVDRLTTHKTLGQLVLKSVMYLLIPYIYLFACGFVFDYLLNWYWMTTFIFVSLCVFALIAIALVVMSIYKFNKAKKLVGK